MRLQPQSTRLLLISNSSQNGRGSLDHVEPEMRSFFGAAHRILFVPFAFFDRRAYAERVRSRMAAMDYAIDSVDEAPDPVRAVASANAVFVGGGNTFRLLKGLQESGLVEPLHRRVAEGMPYAGSSAGSIVAFPTLKTTKDMPAVERLSFEALGLVDFQISPHYLDPDPASTHMGETQEERILQFLEENEESVVGLREGSFLRIDGASILLKGSAPARVFRPGEPPIEVAPGADLGPLLSRARAGFDR